jgi:hypothetical protein
MLATSIALTLACVRRSYWEKRYVKREKHVASFLADKQLVDKILNTGKYLSVLRECGDAIRPHLANPHSSTLPHPPHKAHHADAWRGGSQRASTQRERERERERESQGGGAGGGGGGKAVVRASPVAALTYSSNSRVYAQLVQEAYVCSSQVHESESERAREIELVQKANVCSLEAALREKQLCEEHVYSRLLLVLQATRASNESKVEERE